MILNYVVMGGASSVCGVQDCTLGLCELLKSGVAFIGVDICSDKSHYLCVISITTQIFLNMNDRSCVVIDNVAKVAYAQQA